MRQFQVDFIVVGGVSAVLHGAPINTFDLDVVHSREPGNLDRLMRALAELDARYRTPGHEQMRPGLSHLESSGHQLLMTLAGPLDLLGTIGHGEGYEELLESTSRMDIGGGLTVRVLDLQALVRIKEEIAREKDAAQLAILRRTLEEKSQR
jgi:hypothetical protein